MSKHRHSWWHLITIKSGNVYKCDCGEMLEPKTMSKSIVLLTALALLYLAWVVVVSISKIRSIEL